MECHSYMKYKIYAEQARKNGYIKIGEIINEISEHEYDHAKLWFKLLHNDNISGMQDILTDMIHNEDYEWRVMYNELSYVARKENLDDIAEIFEDIMEIELKHNEILQKILYRLEEIEEYDNIT